MRAPLVLAAVMIALLPAGAAGQIAPGRSGSSSTQYASQDEYWVMVRDFGFCFARVDPAASWDLLATKPGSRNEALAFKGIRDGKSHQCFSNSSLSASLSILRGSIAEGLMKRGEPVPVAARLATAAASEPRTISEAALCFVAGQRAAAEQIIATSPGSKKELQQLESVSDAWFACVPERARKYAFDPTQIRYRLAEVLLRTAPAEAVPTRVEN